MKLFLESLLEEGRALPDDQLVCPYQDDPVKEDETVIGTVDHDLKIFLIKAHALKQELITQIDAHNRLHIENKVHDSEECLRLREELQKLSDRYDYLMSVFWDELRRSIPDGDKIDVVGVRTNWQVVKVPEREESGQSGIVLLRMMPS